MSEAELACVWVSMLDISDRQKQNLFSITEPEFLINNLEAFKDEIEEEIGREGYDELLKISKVDVINFVDSVIRQKGNIITKYSSEYPSCLLDLAYPPYVLYYCGDISLLNSQMLTIVGTRRCSAEGFATTRKISEIAASAGITIVSGLADGIDSSAHMGALDAGGKTIAVLGFGYSFLTNTPSRKLAVEILKAGGLIISEYKPSLNPSRITFPIRNRIMAALSSATLIGEAPLKSGTVYTAEKAIELKRKVFAVAGKIGSRNSEYGLKLIREKKADCLTSAQDILDFYGIECKSVSDGFVDLSDELNEEEKAVYELLKVEDLHISDLLKRTKYDIKKLNNLLTNMEISGIISKLAGGYYTLNT